MDSFGLRTTKATMARVIWIVFSRYFDIALGFRRSESLNDYTLIYWRSLLLKPRKGYVNAEVSFVGEAEKLNRIQNHINLLINCLKLNLMCRNK
jgi:choline-glycine betaine transporter